MTIHIDIVDQSTFGSRYDWDKIGHAVQSQIRYDVSGPWGIGNAATVKVVDKPAAGHWPVYLMDDSDVPGALGYHEVDYTGVLPVGKVFVATDRKYGLEPSVTLSHECVEIVGDPMAQACFQATATQFWVQELCDAVEADRLGYELDGVLLSDFVLPSWFYADTAKRYSFRGNVTKPRTLAPGGYQAYFDITTRTWKQITAQAAPGVTSRAQTLGLRGRVHGRALLQEWAEAVPQPSVQADVPVTVHAC
jgi:hypothetical protein